MVKIFNEKSKRRPNHKRQRPKHSATHNHQTCGQNKEQTLHIDTIDHAGQALCLSTKPITIVEDALPGEECRIEIIQQHKKVQKARIVELVKASDKRRKPFCEFYERCGGCSLQHVSATDGFALKYSALKAYLHKMAGIVGLDAEQTNNVTNVWQAPIETFASNKNATAAIQFAYRRRVKLAVDARNKQNVLIGFRSNHSQKIQNIPHCAIATEQVNMAIKFVHTHVSKQQWLTKVGHIVITEGANETQLALYISKPIAQKDCLDIKGKASRENIKLVFILKNTQTQQHESNKAYESSITINDIKNVKLHLASDHFLQVNQSVNATMLVTAKAWLQPSAQTALIDFYCGAGNFALAFAACVQKVYGFEVSEKMVAAAQFNAQQMSINNCQFTCADLSSAAQITKINVPEGAFVIMDPSREGALDICEYLIHNRAQKILYVSCNPNTFARDAKALQQVYNVTKIAALDMFPFTKHIELMALFEKK